MSAKDAFHQFLKHWRIVQQILQARSQIKLTYSDIEPETMFDTERNQYQIVSVNWN